MKHGSGSEEHLHSSSSISPCSPGLPQLWEVSMANKGSHMHPNSYMNSFAHWYPNHPPHQDAMPRPQMMWVLCFWFHAGQMLGPPTSTPTPSTRVIKTLACARITKQRRHLALTSPQFTTSPQAPKSWRVQSNLPAMAFTRPYFVHDWILSQNEFQKIGLTFYK